MGRLVLRRPGHHLTEWRPEGQERDDDMARKVKVRAHVRRSGKGSKTPKSKGLLGRFLK